MAPLGINDPVLQEEDNLHPYAEPLAYGAGAIPHGIIARIKWLFTADHPYVFLGTSVLCIASILTSFWAINALTSPLMLVFLPICALWVLFSLVPLCIKIATGKRYRARSPFCTPRGRKVVRILSYVAWVAAIGLFIVVPVATTIARAADVTQLAQRPQDFFSAQVYMLWNSRQIFVTGIITTIQLALFGTVFGFVLALLLVFLRVQVPDRSDNDAIRFIKWLGSAFARFYSTVVRGTPMMVQGAIVFYAGLAILRSTGMSVAEINAIYPPFAAGLITISLNSTAYMMEVLRGGIEAVDGGQLEAARSLGLSQWQAMRKVVFPQGIKNSIPALSNELIVNIKDSSVLSIIGVFDLMFATTSVIGIYAVGLENYTTAVILYLCLTMAFSKLLGIAAKRLDMDAPGPVTSTSIPPKKKAATA